MGALARRSFVLALVAGCSSPPAGPRFLLALSAPAPVEKYDLFVRDDAARKVVLHTGWSDATKEGTRDLAKAPFRIGLRLTRAGRYSLAVAGAIGPLDGDAPAIPAGARQFYWATSVMIAGDARIDARLVEVPAGDDRDRDLFPDAAAWPARAPEAAAIATALLDCADGVAAENPMAAEVCGDGIDQDCDGADDPCADRDQDGDPDATDCAPDDPAVHHPTKDDPFPETANCCGYQFGKTGAEATKTFPALCHPERCGDAIDHDCDGTAARCVVDEDCDRVPPPADCDDRDATVGPGAPEVCNGRDDNCNGLVDETCVACDLDGDGVQRMDPKNGCAPAVGQPADCDDEDAGVFPGSTMAPVRVPRLVQAKIDTCAGAEGGNVACALRGACRNTRPDGAPQDADCDGKLREADGCPPAACDADGDGFIDQMKSGVAPCPMAAQPDCNDKDPTVFPGAPDRCGDGVAQNCFGDAVCGSDPDGDGYDELADCDNTDAAVRPWALERCNGLDDDCDGLRDEGNPDAAGKRMVDPVARATFWCTASKVGACASPRGRCVCSSASLAGAHFDQKMRDACPGEDDAIDRGSAPAPRCYFAAQPSPDVCNRADDDCNGKPDDPVADCPGPSPAPLCCDGACTNVTTDPAHCGGCPGVACVVANATPACVGGKCAVRQCNPGWADCDTMAENGCEVSTATDVANCGACGNVCPTVNGTAACSGGRCGIGSCAAPFKDCDGDDKNGCEINTGNDVMNCGDCKAACAKVANGSPACKAGACAVGTCNKPFADCNAERSDGCETNTDGSTQHCGACGTACATPPHATASCMMGKCAVGGCETGWKDCDGLAASGCEAAVDSDVNNCGACGKKCMLPTNGFPGCVAGVCRPTCNMPFADCNLDPKDCEVNTATDANNCGACAKKCAADPAGNKCRMGACGCMAGGDCGASTWGKGRVNGTCGCNTLAECGATVADACAGNRCMCGLAPPCTGGKLCVKGQCLLDHMASCMNNAECASGKCMMMKCTKP